MGMQRSGADELAGSTANGESTGRKRLLQMLGALEGERLSAQGQKMAALGNDSRLAAMLVSAKNDDEAATAAKIAAILEEPPRMGNSDLGVAVPRNQPPGSNVVSNC